MELRQTEAEAQQGAETISGRARINRTGRPFLLQTIEARERLTGKSMLGNILPLPRNGGEGRGEGLGG